MAERTKALIDGDGILYRCGFAVEKTHYLTEHGQEFKHYAAARDIPKDLHPEAVVWSRKTLEPVENAKFLVKNVLTKIAERYSDKEIEIWLSPSVGNFREQIAKTAKYKGNRDAAAKPKHFKELYDYLVGEFGAVVTRGQEADDALGIGATLFPGSVIVSLDKDLDQVPGLHYDWVKEKEYGISKKEGTINFYSQVLSGDTTDNIFGLRGVGPATARKMLADAASSRDCWEVVLGAYRDQEGEHSEERAIENARLCWVRRKEDELWEPPTKGTGSEAKGA